MDMLPDILRTLDVDELMTVQRQVERLIRIRMDEKDAVILRQRVDRLEALIARRAA